MTLAAVAGGCSLLFCSLTLQRWSTIIYSCGICSAQGCAQGNISGPFADVKCVSILLSLAKHK